MPVDRGAAGAIDFVTALSESTDFFANCGNEKFGQCAVDELNL